MQVEESLIFLRVYLGKCNLLSFLYLFILYYLLYILYLFLSYL